VWAGALFCVNVGCRGGMTMDLDPDTRIFADESAATGGLLASTASQSLEHDCACLCACGCACCFV
jgi:hypothetical protein